MAHPPRSKPPLRSSSAPPSPWITPSTVTCVVDVSFMVAVPFSPFRSRWGRPSDRTDLIGCGTGSALSYRAPAVYAGARAKMDQFRGFRLGGRRGSHRGLSARPLRGGGPDRLHEDRALARGIGLLAAAHEVHAQGFLARGHAQRADEADELEQRERGAERVSRRGERGQRLVAELGRVAVKQAV